MTTTVSRRYHFESAHWLPGVAETHRCHRLHGHNYEIEVTVSGEPDPVTGFIIDFWDLDKVVQPIINLIDHRVLNDIDGLENPTAELIADWFQTRLCNLGLNVSKVICWETKDCHATVTL